MKIKGKRWFTGREGALGIVIVELTPKEQQDFDVDGPEGAFIGRTVPGNAEKDDVEQIVKMGARFPVAAAHLAIFGE